MKKNLQLISIFFILFMFSNCTKSRNGDYIFYDRSYKDQIKEAHKEMGYFLTSNFIPGGSIAIMKEGKLIYSEGFGNASKDLDIYVNRNTKFRIGSLSEIFTALMYYKMEEDGILNSDSTLQHYYPDFPEKEHPLVLKNLVQHTSGIRPANYEDENWRGLNISLEKGLDRIKEDPMFYPPGVEQIESMWNYNLLGVAMEKATELRYHELLKQYLTDTLQLGNTCVDHPFLTIKNRSNFFHHNFISQVVNATDIDLRYRAPSSGILSSAEDLAQLGNHIISSDYFSEVKEKLSEKVLLNNGMPAALSNGWYTLNTKENAAYGRVGTIKGGSSAIFMYPEEQLVIAFCTNLTEATNDLPILKIANLFLPKTENADKK